MINLEKDVRSSLRQHEASAKHVEEEIDEGGTLGQQSPTCRAPGSRERLIKRAFWP